MSSSHAPAESIKPQEPPHPLSPSAENKSLPRCVPPDDAPPPPVSLEPFVHQVGGHFPMVCLGEDIVCKPLKDREHRFYKSLPAALRPFAPAFVGTMRVETSEDADGYITLRGQPPVDAAAHDLHAHHHHPHYRLKHDDSIQIEPVSDDGTPLLLQPSNVTHGQEVVQEERVADDAAASSAGDVFCNPWALKCHRDHLKKLGLLRPPLVEASEDACDSGRRASPAKPQMYLLLENLVSKYRHPCILDLKVGVRQYSDDVSAAKKQRKIAKSANTTLATLGVRLCGMQLYDADRGKYVCHNKYFGRSLGPADFKRVIEQFFGCAGGGLRRDLICIVMEKLEALKKVLLTLDSFRFYTSSLLVTYDGSPSESQEDEEDEDPVDVRIIDFAHSTHKGFKEAILHSGADHGFVCGLENFFDILKDISGSGDSPGAQLI